MPRKIFALFLPFVLSLLGLSACDAVFDQPEKTGLLEETSTPQANIQIPLTEGGNPQFTYYLSPLGSDHNDGTTPLTAFATLSHSLQVAQPGESIGVLPGTYVEGAVADGIGSTTAPILIQGIEPTPVFDGQRAITIGLWCVQCVNLVVDNLAFTNYTDAGIGVVSSTQITMQNLVVYENGFAAQLVDWEFEGYGIDVDSSTRISVLNNHVYHNGPNPRPFGALGTGVNTFACVDCAIRGNYSHDNIGGGILVEDSIGVVVEDNVVKFNFLDATEDGWWDGGLWIDGGHDILVRNNLFQENIGPGVEISDEDFQNPYGYVLENNTVLSNTYGLYIWNFGTNDLPPEEVLRLANNLIIGNTTLDIWIAP